MKQNRSENRNLRLFFLIAFAWSWLFWIPKALVSQGLLSIPPVLGNILLGPSNPAAWGPFIAAFFLTYMNEGGQGVKRLLKSGVDYRFEKIWLIPIFLLFPAVVGCALLLSMLTEGITPNLSVLSNPLTIPIAFVYIFFLGGPLQEEFGWRGYALDRLQAKWNALISSIILGFIWGVWHLPLFFMSMQAMYYQRPIWGLMISTILLSILFTWLYNNTRKSILAVLIFHTMFNLSHYVFPALETELGSLYAIILPLIVVIIVVTIWGPKRMVRERYVKTTAPNI
ncbi:MAG: Uncharacterized protein XD78_0680 [Desulfotomaculum sp. 46_296]|nr:MAG: Uncharacterized protein XD78_0680 [Desulfotomaculum sp. 46_296]HAU30860.1 CPBP family intramembrane metalloprotease [Desulfotomaculum sp.]